MRKDANAIFKMALFWLLEVKINLSELDCFQIKIIASFHTNTKSTTVEYHSECQIINLLNTI